MRRLWDKQSTMSLAPFLYGDLYRPTRLLEQHFGLALSPEELDMSTLSPLSAYYYRPWRHSTDSGSTVMLDKDKFQVFLDVQQFHPDEITVKTNSKEIIIEGKHDERLDEHGVVSRQFVRKYRLPEGCNSDQVSSSLTADGVLIVNVNKLTSLMSRDKERFVPITKTAAICQKSAAKKDTAQNIKESTLNKFKEDGSCDLNSTLKEECTKNDSKIFSSLKEESARRDSKLNSKALSASEERSCLLNVDETLKMSSSGSEMSGDALRASARSGKLDFTSSVISESSVMSASSKEMSSYSCEEMSCGVRTSSDKASEFISDLITTELKLASDNL